MNALSLSSFARAADYAPLVARVVAGVIVFAHGWQKLMAGPGMFGKTFLAGLGVPAPVLMGYVVTFTEVVGGALLVIGLLSRLAALLLTIDLVMAILLVKIKQGLITGIGKEIGSELELLLVAGFLVVLLAGPGRLSADRALGIDPPPGSTLR